MALIIVGHPQEFTAEVHSVLCSALLSNRTRTIKRRARVI
jgi:hypothetical protein